MDQYAQTKRIIFLGMVIAPLLPLFLSLGIGAYSAYSALEDTTCASVRRIAEDHADMVEAFLRERLADLEIAAGSLHSAYPKDESNLRELFENLQSASDAWTDLGLVAPDGRQAAYVGPFSLGHVDYSKESWYADVLQNGSAVSDMFHGYRGIPHFIIAVAETIGNETWVLRGTVDQRVFDRLVSDIRLGAGGEAFLVDSLGRLQTETRSGAPLLQPMDVPAEENRVTTIYVNDEPYFAVSVPISDGGRRRLVVRLPKEEALAPLRNTGWIILSILLAGGGGIVITAATSGNRIVNRLRKAEETRTALEHQLIMAARSAELGEMAAGFAHEINNPLQVMKSDLTLMEMNLADIGGRDSRVAEPEELAELDESMSQMRTQIDRCAAITGAVLKFGRHGERNPEMIDLKTALPQFAGMVAKKAEVSGVALSIDVQPGIARVHADAGELQQVILNLLNNALHAVADQRGAKGGSVAVHADMGSPDTVRILVEDNGAGISQENLERIFTPFFTTKQPGKGTGLGLSVCSGIIDRMGGTISVESEKGNGTRFTILIPAA